MTTLKAENAIQVCLSSEEKKQVEAFSKAIGCSPADLFKHCLIHQLHSPGAQILWLAILGRHRFHLLMAQLDPIKQQFRELINTIPVVDDRAKQHFIQQEEKVFQTCIEQLTAHGADLNQILSAIQTKAITITGISEAVIEADLMEAD
ncbi:MAG: hypothetical protein QNJ46_35285 [Leptolyngbyaceae cyanobacterium MO_188.B28]|nr:hypothetical protein [Leptolyngbyaceae cyanobacterium MO_188.B28]